MSTQLTAAEIQANRTQGEWSVGQFIDGHKNEHGNRIRNSDGELAVQLNDKDYLSELRSDANAAAIVSAVNGTYGRGIDPDVVWLLNEALERIMELSNGYNSQICEKIFNICQRALAAAKLPTIQTHSHE